MENRRFVSRVLRRHSNTAQEVRHKSSPMLHQGRVRVTHRGEVRMTHRGEGEGDPQGEVRVKVTHRGR